MTKTQAKSGRKTCQLNTQQSIDGAVINDYPYVISQTNSAAPPIKPKKERNDSYARLARNAAVVFQGLRVRIYVFEDGATRFQKCQEKKRGT